MAFFLHHLTSDARRLQLKHLACSVINNLLQCHLANVIETQETADLFQFFVNLGCSCDNRSPDGVFHRLYIRIQRLHRQYLPARVGDRRFVPDRRRALARHRATRASGRPQQVAALSRRRRHARRVAR